MLIPFGELLATRGAGTAVGAFTCYDLEAAGAVLGAAATAGAGVILLIGARSHALRDGGLLLAGLLAAAERAEARACVQLDHCADLAVIESVLSAGAGAVMADGSALAYEDNVAFVRRAVEAARRHDAAVEAELGGIMGDEDVDEAAAAGALTDPEQAVDLVARTGADCLAVSIGNVHGAYREPPRLDWERLSAIAAGVSAPLALHGASGLPEPTVRRSIELGVAKVNVNTELRRAYLEATERRLPDVLAGARLDALHRAQAEAVGAVVETRLAAFGGRSE